MKYIISTSLALFCLGLAFGASKARAEESVIIDHTEFTCTNACEVYVLPNGGWGVRDCCGGSIIRIVLVRK
ncbi:hypothetical protein [Dokdonella sp.]|uniref:hypothetical protein n=1 Tax=Dokdonella sp. TaxID=2291710 RepID=UPI0025C50DD0|nr:hypothetical protein [Dokdonella sp.]MBX3687822.1 hypothetical protein [Dokdonella sp.]